MKKAEKLEQARAMACTKESVYSWFDHFEKFLEENNVKSEDQIYNCDESGFPLQAGSSMKVLCHKHSRRNFQITSSAKTSITTLQCICANGNIIPPCVLFPGVKFNLEYSIGFQKNFYLGFTKNGWMDTKQFCDWIMNHFVKKIPLLHPVVLLVDGHGSHIDYYVSKFCLENRILLFRLPPHTSHAIQPTDRGFSGAFKHNFSKETAKFTVEHPGVSITKCQLPYIFTKAYESSCKMETLKSSFRATGIWPTDRLQVDHDLFNPSKADRDSNLSNISQNLPINFEVESTSTAKTQTPDQGDNADSVLGNLASSCPSFSARESPHHQEGDSFSINEKSESQLSIQCGPSAPTYVVQESIATESESTQRDISAYLPSSIPKIQQSNFVSLPGGDASASQNVPSMSTPKPSSQHPVQRALLDLEKGLGNKKHIFLNRYIEGYDSPGHSLCVAWKALHSDWQLIQEKINQSNFSNESFDDINPIINSVLKYPTIQRNAKIKKSKSSDLPKHMTTEQALIILKQKEDEKYRPEIVKEAKRQKKRTQRKHQKQKESSPKNARVYSS